MIVEPDFMTHWKTRALTDLLGEGAPGCVLRLWAHCQQRRTDRLDVTPATLASICGYPPGKAQEFYDAMLGCGFIEIDGETIIAHDWAETNALLLVRWKGGESTKKKFKGVPGGTASAKAMPGAKLPAKPELNETLDSLARAKLQAEREHSLERVEKSREEKNKSPLPSPKVGGQPTTPENVQILNTSCENPENVMITDTAVAKKLICEKILKDKNPARAWSYDAEERLSQLCNRDSPMPLSEILVIGRFRAIPWAEDVPELAKRIEPVTETGLMRYWGDEVQRATAYFQKYAPKRRPKNKEPARWREFFIWKYGENIRHPASYDLLGSDQKQEYERDFKTFEQSKNDQRTTAGATT